MKIHIKENQKQRYKSLKIAEDRREPDWLREADIEDAAVEVDYNGNVKWYDGKWHNGDFRIGVWYNGEWYSGIWQNGVWHGGKFIMGKIWNDAKKAYQYVDSKTFKSKFGVRE